MDLRLQLRSTKEDLQTKERMIEDLKKRDPAKDNDQAQEIERLKAEVADKVRIIQSLEESKSTRDADDPASAVINGLTVLERWQSNRLVGTDSLHGRRPLTVRPDGRRSW